MTILGGLLQLFEAKPLNSFLSLNDLSDYLVIKLIVQLQITLQFTFPVKLHM